MENSIAWIFIFPLFGSVLCGLLGLANRNACHPISVLCMAGSFWAGVETLLQAVASESKEVSYLFGGWTLDSYPRGVGIEFRADMLRCEINRDGLRPPGCRRALSRQAPPTALADPATDPGGTAARNQRPPAPRQSTAEARGPATPQRPPGRGASAAAIGASAPGSACPPPPG